MAQAYDPLTATRTFAESYGTLNSSDEALRSLHSGATAPASTVAYMLWVDTTAGLIKQRNATNDGWITVAQIGVTNGGLLPTSGGVLAGNLDAGGFKVTNAAAATASGDLVRKAELDLKAPLAAPALTGDATVNQDPTGDNSLIRRLWAEGRYLKLAGGTMTALFNLFADATAALHAVTLQQLKAFVLFNTTTGHRHDNVDARRVRGTDIDSGAEPATKVLGATGTGVSVWVTKLTPFVALYPTSDLFSGSAPSTAWQTIDVSAAVSASATAAFLKVVFSPSGGSSALRLRADGVATDSTQMEFPSSTATVFTMIVALASDKKFQWRVTSTPASLTLDLLGYFQA